MAKVIGVQKRKSKQPLLARIIAVLKASPMVIGVIVMVIGLCLAVWSLAVIKNNGCNVTSEELSIFESTAQGLQCLGAKSPSSVSFCGCWNWGRVLIVLGFISFFVGCVRATRPRKGLPFDADVELPTDTIDEVILPHQ